MAEQPKPEPSANLREVMSNPSAEQMIVDAAADYDPNWDKGNAGNYGSAKPKE